MENHMKKNKINWHHLHCMWFICINFKFSQTDNSHAEIKFEYIAISEMK